MTQHKIERKKLTVEIYGIEYNLAKPKFKDIVEMQDKLETLTAAEKFLFIKKNLIESGIPEEVIDDMDGDNMIELLDIINGSKKN